MFYHHAIIELEAEARTRDLRATAAAPAIGNLLPAFLRRRSQADAPIPPAQRPTPGNPSPSSVS